MNGVSKNCRARGLKKAQTEATDDDRKINNEKKKKRLALKRMIQYYPDILPFTRDACDLRICASQSEARRLYTLLKE